MNAAHDSDWPAFGIVRRASAASSDRKSAQRLQGGSRRPFQHKMAGLPSSVCELEQKPLRTAAAARTDKFSSLRANSATRFGNGSVVQ